MSSNKWDIATWGGGPIPDVIVALFPGESVTAVARAAVREATGRGARLRFVQVHGVSGTDRAAEDETTFAAALRALREYPRLPVTFESVEYSGAVADAGGDGGAAAGDEGTSDLEIMLVERSRHAAVLVLGTATDAEHRLAAHCQRRARCDVLLVRDPVPEPESVPQMGSRTS